MGKCASDESSAWDGVVSTNRNRSIIEQEKIMTDAPWYKTFFGEDYLHIYEPILTPERTRREVDGIVNLLALPQGSSILDLCCGHGRHAIPLAQRGFQVTGQDLSEVFLREAEKEAQAQSVHAQWLHGDMRNIPFENEFDAAINIFTALAIWRIKVRIRRCSSRCQRLS